MPDLKSQEIINRLNLRVESLQKDKINLNKTIKDLQADHIILTQTIEDSNKKVKEFEHMLKHKIRTINELTDSLRTCSTNSISLSKAIEAINNISKY